MKRFAFFVWTLFLPISGFSLSCGSLESHFFIQCANGVCEKAFRVAEIRTELACGRRVVVADAPADIVKVLSGPLLQQNAADKEPRIYDVILHKRFYDETPESDEQLAKDILVKDSAPSHLAGISATPHGTTFETLRRKWEEREDSELFRLRVYAAADKAILTVCLIVLLATAAKFSKLANGLFRQDKSGKKIFYVLLVQAGLFVIGLVPWATFLWSSGYLMLLEPVIFLVLLYELAFFFYVVIFKRSSYRELAKK